MRFPNRTGVVTVLILAGACELPGQDMDAFLTNPAKILDEVCTEASQSDNAGLDSLHRQWVALGEGYKFARDLQLRIRDEKAKEVAKFKGQLDGKKRELAAFDSGSLAPLYIEERQKRALLDSLVNNKALVAQWVKSIQKLEDLPTLQITDRAAHARKLDDLRTDLAALRRELDGERTWDTQIAKLRQEINALVVQRSGAARAARKAELEEEIVTLTYQLSAAQEDLALAKGDLGRARSAWAMVTGMQLRVEICLDQRREALGVSSGAKPGQLTGTYRGTCGSQNVPQNGTFALAVGAASNVVTGTISEPGGVLTGLWERVANGSVSGFVTVNGGGGSWSGLLVQSATGAMTGQGTASYAVGDYKCAVNWKGP